MRTRRHAAALGLCGAVCAAMTLFGSGTASAGVGSYPHDNQDPSASGCNNDAITASSANVGGGATILLRYSPSCRTVWAHIQGAAPRTQDNAGGSALIYRESDGAGIRTYCGAATSCYTPMLYDAGMTSHATGTNDTGFTIYSGTTGSY
ncbi:Protein of unknown function [Actinacidiphila paucisporea]|uniref:DUF2690 domain-containing protein n=2 Tax=Actinacidiphila paucisporea TaxID=310782 RepID=A0A1M7LZW0_9ACTN|nr:Protein of unknown function [Actinacidiphila paucisporea]